MNMEKYQHRTVRREGNQKQYTFPCPKWASYSLNLGDRLCPTKFHFYKFCSNVNHVRKNVNGVKFNK